MKSFLSPSFRALLLALCLVGVFEFCARGQTTSGTDSGETSWSQTDSDNLADLVPGLIDQTNTRVYLQDIRQILLWVVGLQLVSLTVHGWKAW